MIPKNLGRQRLLHVAGLLVAIVSASFVVVLLRSQWELVIAWRPGPLAIIALLVATLTYAAASLLLAGAWRSILLWSGETAVTTRDAFHVYCRSQIAKYIPGNIAQLIGRHLLGRQRGWSNTGLVVAGIFEMISLIGAAAVIASIGFLLGGIVIRRIDSPTAILLAISLALGAVFAFRLLPYLVAMIWPDIARRLHRCRMIGLWRANLLHLGFFVVTGAVFFLVVFSVADTAPPLSLWPEIFALLAAAWVIGVVTPGAPSGLGVREAVLVLGLSGVMPIAQALLIVGLFRCVTVCGDILFFLAGELQSRALVSGA